MCLDAVVSDVRNSNSATEISISSCKTVALLLAEFPEADRADLLELLETMGRSFEEMEAGVVALREMLSPVVGLLVPMMPPAEKRNPIVQKWSSYIGAKVREYRKLAELTQEELAKRSHLPQPHISRIENGEISPTRLTVEKIAAALGRAVSDFDPSA